MSLSLNNSTIVPLLSGEIFLGKEYDNILDYAEINIAIKCDVGYTITYLYSQDKLSVDYETSQVVGAQLDTIFYKLTVKDRYFKLKIEATDGDMSVLNVQTIYKSVTTFSTSGSATTTDVAITSPLDEDGNVLVSDTVTHNKLTSVYDLLDTKTNALLWSASPTGVNGVSNAVNLSALKISNMTFMGNCNNATLLTVQFSNDGTTYYDSQYSYNLTGAGDFGFNLTCCPNYLRMKSSQNVTATVIVNAS